MPSNLAGSEYKSRTSGRITVKRGLEGQDDNIDVLEKYFNEMQKFTVETSMPADFLSFAACAHYFGVIMLGGDESLDDCGDEDAEGEPEEDSEAIAIPIYPESSTATSPPASTIGSPFSLLEQERETSGHPPNEPYAMLSSLSRQEKILKWTEAFTAELADEDGEPMIPPLQPIGLLEIGGEGVSYGKGKGKLSEGSPYLIPQACEPLNTEPQSDMEQDAVDPENFINWPDDDMAVDDTSTIYDVYESPRGIVDSELCKDGPQQVVEKESAAEDSESETHSTVTTPELVKIFPGSEVETLIYNAAIEFQEGLRTRRIEEYEKKKARQALQPPPQFVRPSTSLPNTLASKSKEAQPIGLVYLLASQKYEDLLHMGECTLGFYIAPEYRENYDEHLVKALNIAIKEAFDDQQCHRLQSIVVDNHDKLFSFTLLTACGFRHEGVRRHGFFSPTAQEYRDVFYYAMLATEWVHDSDQTSSARLRTASLWEEVLARHQRERDDLHRLEEKRMRRSQSIETVRQPPPSMTRKKVVLGTVAQARHQQAGSRSSQDKSNNTETLVPGESSQSPVRARYETNIPSSSSPKRSRGNRSVGGSSFSSSSTASDLSSQWELLDDF